MIKIMILNHNSNMRAKRNILILIIILFIISIINLYNAKYLNIYYENYYLKQIIWYIFSFTFLFIINKLNIKNIFNYSKFFYWSNILLLIYVLFYGKVINGSKGWINLGFISMQPSEFMKISLLLYLIYIIENTSSLKFKILKILFYTLIPSVLVFLEPDTGAIIFYLVIMFTLIIMQKIKLKYYIYSIISLILLIVLFIYLYIYYQDLLIKIMGTSIFYRIDRLVNFKTNNYQLNLALISVFSAPIIRNGFNNISIYIPEGATDFIYAFCIGNFGIILGLIIIVCYTLFFINMINMIKKNNNKKTNYLIISFLVMFFVQVIINIYMNIGLFPIIGITLPFLSYGGSSLIVYFILISLIFSLTKD